MAGTKEEGSPGRRALHDATRHAQTCGAKAEALKVLATVSKNELDGLRAQLRGGELSPGILADWETFWTVAVLMDTVIDYADTVATEAEAIEHIGMRLARAA